MSGLPDQEGSEAGRSRETRILFALWFATLIASSVTFSLWVERRGPVNLRYVWLEAVALATVPGKFAVFGGLAPDSPLDPWGVAVLGVVVDTFLAMTLALGLAPFMRLPGIGAWLRSAHESASKALSEYPRLKRMAFWGAALFVALPVPGSGWMGGTFAGQLLGLSRLMGIAAIAVGTALVTLTFAGMAALLGDEAAAILRSPWIFAAGFVALILLVWILWRRFQSLLRRS
jgi:uncharacterized membrane protein